MEPAQMGIQSGMKGVVMTEADYQVGSLRQNATLDLLGMTLTEIRPDDEARKKLVSQHCVAVLVVEWDSEAYRGGVRSGDIIAEVNNTPIRSLHDMKKVLSHHDPHAPMLVFILNNGEWHFTTLSFIR
jgi:S1-C subfamily serine protease